MNKKQNKKTEKKEFLHFKNVKRVNSWISALITNTSSELLYFLQYLKKNIIQLLDIQNSSTLSFLQ